MRRVLIIGHRGAMAYRPENTMSSFRLAIEMGVEMFELDVKLSKDGVPVVIHDQKVNRTTNGRGYVSNLTASELGKLKIRGNEHIPTLSEVLDELGGKCEINIELKAKGTALPSYKLVAERKLLSRVVFSSFLGMELAKLKAQKEKARLAFLCEDRSINMLSVAERLGAEAVNPKHKLVTPELIENAHARGLKVNVWTINSRKKMTRFIEMGVDGIITNKPDVLAKLLDGT